MYTGVDPILLVSVAAAVSLIYLAVLGWSENSSGLLSRLFAALAVIAAWWTVGMALHFSPLAAVDPRFASTSQILSGFFGPVLLLFTLTYVGRIERWWWGDLLLCVPAIAGPVNYVLLWLFVPMSVLRTSLADYYAGIPITALPIVRAAPWYVPLQSIHAVQIAACIVASTAIFAVYGLRERLPVHRRDRLILAAIHVAGLVALLLIYVSSPVGGRQVGARMSPLLSVPSIAVLYRFMRRREAALRTMSRYLPTHAVDHLLHAEQRTVPQVFDAAVLFSDLRGFTALSERIAPAVILTWLDGYVAAMNEAILAEHGMVERLMGDGLVAVFGVPTPLVSPCAAALRAAEHMQRELQQINARTPVAAGVATRMGIGITFGPVVIGSVGNALRKTYTVLGDTVNTAQRLESLSKESPYSILLSRAVVERLNAPECSRSRFCGSITLAGRVQPIDVFGYPWDETASVRIRQSV